MTPEVRLTDDAAHQLVRVTFGDTGGEYGYAWAGEGALCVGDAVTIERPGYLRGTVVGLGSDCAGPFTFVGEKLRRR